MAAIIPSSLPGNLGDVNNTQQQLLEQLAAAADALAEITGNANVGVDALTSSVTLYVDSSIGSDDLSNTGRSIYRPYRTIQRALLETARRSILPGTDSFETITIYVRTGENVVYNGPGSSSASVFPQNIDAASEASRRAFYQSLNPDGVAGVIIPRGVSIIGADLRKTVIRPDYVGASPDTRAALFKITGASFFTGFTFKDKAGSTANHAYTTCFTEVSSAQMAAYYEKVKTVFGLGSNAEVINPGETQIVAAATIPEVDSVLAASAYVFSCSLRSSLGLCGVDVDGAAYTGLRSFLAAQFTIISLQRYASQGATGEFVDGQGIPKALTSSDATGEVGGLRYRGTRVNDAVDWRHFGYRARNQAYFQLVSCFVIGPAIDYWTQSGGEISLTNSNSNFGDVAFQSEGFQAALLDGTIADCTNAAAIGGATPQDSGYTVVGVRRPLPLPSTPSELPFAFIHPDETFADTTSIKLVGATNGIASLLPYSLINNDILYVNLGLPGGPLTVRTATTGTVYSGGDTGQLSLQSGSNGIASYLAAATSSTDLVNRQNLLKAVPLYIKRIRDNRVQDDANYHLRVTVPSGKKPPVPTYVFRINKSVETSISQFIPDGTLLPYVFDSVLSDSNIYRVTLLNADDGGTTQGIEDLAVDLTSALNADPSTLNLTAIATATSSATYRTIRAILIRFGLSSGAADTLLAPNATQDVALATPVAAECNRPSIIRSGNHFFELKGTRNYSSGLPQFQPTLLGQGLSANAAAKLQLSKITTEKKGGRNLFSGLTESGDFYIGNQKIDFRTGRTQDNRFTSTLGKVFVPQTGVTPAPTDTSSSDVKETLTVRSVLRVQGLLDLGINDFVQKFNPPAALRASTSQYGLVRRTSNVSNSLDTTNYVTPSDLKDYVNSLGLQPPTVAPNPGATTPNAPTNPVFTTRLTVRYQQVANITWGRVSFRGTGAVGAEEGPPAGYGYLLSTNAFTATDAASSRTYSVGTRALRPLTLTSDRNAVITTTVNTGSTRLYATDDPQGNNCNPAYVVDTQKNGILIDFSQLPTNLKNCAWWRVEAMFGELGAGASSRVAMVLYKGISNNQFVTREFLVTARSNAINGTNQFITNQNTQIIPAPNYSLWDGIGWVAETQLNPGGYNAFNTPSFRITFFDEVTV